MSLAQACAAFAPATAATLNGVAEGLLVCGDSARVDERLLLMLRVEKRGTHYWALWGLAAKAPGLSPYRGAGLRGALLAA